MQFKLGVHAESREQTGSQITIELNGIESATADNEGLRQRSLTRANLYQVIRLRWADGPLDRVDHTFVAQKVLAESLAGVMPHDAHG